MGTGNEPARRRRDAVAGPPIASQIASQIAGDLRHDIAKRHGDRDGDPAINSLLEKEAEVHDAALLRLARTAAVEFGPHAKRLDRVVDQYPVDAHLHQSFQAFGIDLPCRLAGAA